MLVQPTKISILRMSLVYNIKLINIKIQILSIDQNTCDLPPLTCNYMIRKHLTTSTSVQRLRIRRPQHQLQKVCIELSTRMSILKKSLGHQAKQTAPTLAGNLCRLYKLNIRETVIYVARALQTSQNPGNLQCPKHYRQNK